MTRSALEDAILGSVQRGMPQLTEYTQGSLESAARDVLATERTQVVIVTGFPIVIGSAAWPETDGPVGAAQLAYALNRLGIPVRLLTDTVSRRAVEVALEALALTLPIDVAPSDPSAADTTNGRYRDWELRVVRAYQQVTHMISVERAGPAADGRVYNMSGIDITEHTAPLHRLFTGQKWATIAIGDGGNELGMGCLPAAAVSAAVKHGDRIHCVIPADHLILSGTSNWGAAGLAIELARQSRSPRLLEAIRPRLSYRLVEALYDNQAAIDGITGEPMRSVDGIEWSKYCLQLETMLPRFPR